jgi:hypothetical protein
MTAVPVVGAMPKDDGTGNLSQSGGNSDGTVEHLVAPPPGPLLADIICGRRDAAQKHCRLVAMLTTTMTAQMTMVGYK